LDEALFNRCLAGEMEAFGQLYEKYSELVYRTSLLLVRNRGLAEDVMQETFIHLFSKIVLFKRRESFEGWLYRITINMSKNALRKQQGWGRWKRILHMDRQYDSGITQTPEGYFEAKEKNAELFEKMKSLAYASQAILVLRYFNDKSVDEIATIMNVPAGTVKSRIHHALRKLRTEMTRDEGVLDKGGLTYD